MKRSDSKKAMAAVKGASRGPWGWGAWTALSILASLAFAAVFLAPTLGAGFVWQDKLLATHPLYLRSGLGWPVIVNPVLLDPSWMWRPVGMAAVALQLDERSAPAPWHMVQIGLWMALGALSCQISMSGLRKGAPELTPKMAAALAAVGASMLAANGFVGQPAWQIAGIFEISAGLMLAAGVFLSERASSDGAKALALAAGFALSTLCDEAAAAAIVPMAVWLGAPGQGSTVRRRALVGMGVWLCAWLAARSVIFGGPFGHDWLGSANGWTLASEWAARVGAMAGLGAPKWPGAAAGISEAGVSWSVAMPCVLVLAALGAGSARARPWARLGWAIVGAAALMCFCEPLASAAESSGSSRLAILAPWLVLTWAMALGDLRVFAEEWLGARGAGAVAASRRAGVATLAVALAWLGSQAAIGWGWRDAYQSDLALWSASWEADKSNAAAASNLMLSYQKSRRAGRALEVGDQFWGSVSNQSSWSRAQLVAMSNYAGLLNAVGDEESSGKAMATLTRALPQSGIHPLVSINYNVAAGKLGKQQEVVAASNYALASYGRSWRDVKWAAALWAQKAKAQYQLGEAEAARDSFAKAIELEGLADPKSRVDQGAGKPAGAAGAEAATSATSATSAAPERAAPYFPAYDPKRKEALGAGKSKEDWSKKNPDDKGPFR